VHAVAPAAQLGTTGREWPQQAHVLQQAATLIAHRAHPRHISHPFSTMRTEPNSVTSCNFYVFK
jgi:hypothetical protein